MKSYTISSGKPLSQLCKNNSINDFKALEQWLRMMPYGRNSSRTDLSLLFSKYKGTCSSKHALMKTVALENNYSEFELIIGIYKMDKNNTPGILNALDNFVMPYIPEAHTYIRKNDITIDVTNLWSSFNTIKSYVIKELVINPLQIGQFKVDYHKGFIQQWISDNRLNLNLEDVWSIRENCIANLSS